jgi:hypothetical protein
MGAASAEEATLRLLETQEEEEAYLAKLTAPVWMRA